MGLADDIRKKIEKKEQQIAELEYHREMLAVQIKEATAALQAYQEILKITPRDGDESDEPIVNVRAGSMVAMARDALRKTGTPLHVGKLLEAMGKAATNDAKVSLSGSLSAYVRKNQIFNRPEPNVFGLIEWGVVKDAVSGLVEGEMTVEEAIQQVAKARE